MKPLNITHACLARHAQATPDKPALVIVNPDLTQNTVLSYQRLYEEVTQLAHGLKSLDLPAHSPCLLRCHKNLDFVLLFFAAMAAKLVPISSLSNLTEREEQFILDNAQPSLLYQQPNIALPLSLPSHCHELSYEQLQALKQTSIHPLTIETQAQDPAFITYTSGSTGQPKGVIHAHRTILGREPLRQEWLNLQSHDRVLHTGKPCWTYSMGVGFFDTFYRGATVILYLGEETPDVWFKLIKHYNVSLLATSPIYLRAMTSVTPEKDSLTSLTRVSSAGEKLPEEIADYWQQHYAIPVYEAFGMSEMSTFIGFGPNIAARKGSVGKVQHNRNIALLPIDGGTEPVLIGKTGLLAIHTDNEGFMLGYFKHEDETQQPLRDQWFITGDLMRQDADGYLWHMGRYDDVLNVAGGHRVSPIEIEDIMQQHPAIKQIVCHLSKHGTVDNYLTATIVLNDNHMASNTLANTIHTWCQAKLSANKVPRLIQFINHLPTKATGKIDRKATARIRCQAHAFCP